MSMINENTDPALAGLLTQHATSLVDAIGELRAALAPELERLKALEAGLKAYGPGNYRGMLWDANVAVSERETLDMKAVREKLSEKFIAAHSKISKVTTLKVTARKLKA